MTARGEAGLPTRVAVTGGNGRLGRWVVRGLLLHGTTARVVDLEPPVIGWSERLEFVRANVESGRELRQAFSSCDAVVHLAGLHGAHLAAKVSRRALWEANVSGTGRALEAAHACGVGRFVLATSTSVFGSASSEGDARVLSESTPIAPEDVYDLSKLASERALAQACADTGLSGVALRFGRFFFGSLGDYQLRKLSTGVDVRDAVKAIALALRTPGEGMRLYCVASDLALSEDERRALGRDLPAVIDRHVPKLASELGHLGLKLPPRVGKSVMTERLRAELGYRPDRDLAWWADRLETHRLRGSGRPAAVDRVARGDWLQPAASW